MKKYLPVEEVAHALIGIKSVHISASHRVRQCSVWNLINKENNNNASSNCLFNLLLYVISVHFAKLRLASEVNSAFNFKIDWWLHSSHSLHSSKFSSSEWKLLIVHRQASSRVINPHQRKLKARRTFRPAKARPRPRPGLDLAVAQKLLHALARALFVRPSTLSWTEQKLLLRWQHLFSTGHTSIYNNFNISRKILWTSYLSV